MTIRLPDSPMGAMLAAGLFALATQAGAPGISAAQPDSAVDAAIVRRADAITVGAYCRAAQRALAAPTVINALGGDSTNARTNAALICDPLLSSLSLAALAGRGHASLSTIAKVRTGGSPGARGGLLEAMSEFRSMVRGPDVRPVVVSALGTVLNDSLVQAAETAQNLLVLDRRDRALTRVANYERKLGPGSPQLNGIEVLLNYALQRLVPGFRATPLRGPSPWEAIASYAPGYATGASAGLEAVSASEFGLRRYLFGERFGKSTLWPGYWSAGVLTASSMNGALVWPWRGADHSGVFVSWGDLKVGYIPGRNGQWLVSRQFQAVKWVF